MYRNILKFSAIAKNLSFIKGWKDSFGNTIIVADVGGKKFAFHNGGQGQDWHYFYGIGAKNITSDMPAGRGDFIIEQRVEPEHQSKINELLSTVPESKFSKLKTKSGVSWSPTSEEEKANLASLVQEFANLNSYLSQVGLLYTGRDIKLYGEDLSVSDILKYNIVKKPLERVEPKSSKTNENEAEWRERFYVTAESQIGIPYYWGGDDPGTGFDCSGLIHWSLDKSGLLPGAADMVSGDQLKLGSQISESKLQRGDFIGFKNENGVVHIGLYTGQGTSYLSASGGGRNTKGDNPKAKVQIGDYTRYPAEKIFVSISPLIKKLNLNS
jgi:cell wall-associated NlpC family hydrolase